MSETAMWTAMRPQMSGLHPVRIESRATEPGIPDVNFSHGWIELKYLPSWPVKPGTPVKIEHYTTEQRAWAVSRTLAGGRVFFLLKVGRSEWLLFAGSTAARWVGDLTREQMYTKVMARWLRLPLREELARWLLQ